MLNVVEENVLKNIIIVVIMVILILLRVSNSMRMVGMGKIRIKMIWNLCVAFFLFFSLFFLSIFFRFLRQSFLLFLGESLKRLLLVTPKSALDDWARGGGVGILQRGRFNFNFFHF